MKILRKMIEDETEDTEGGTGVLHPRGTIAERRRRASASTEGARAAKGSAATRGTRNVNLGL